MEDLLSEILFICFLLSSKKVTFQSHLHKSCQNRVSTLSKSLSHDLKSLPTTLPEFKKSMFPSLCTKKAPLTKKAAKGCCLRRLWVISVWPKPSGNYWSCEDIVGVVGDTLGVFSVATMVGMAAAFNASIGSFASMFAS